MHQHVLVLQAPEAQLLLQPLGQVKLKLDLVVTNQLGPGLSVKAEVLMDAQR